MTGVQIAYYFICRRKLWLFVHRLDREQTSDAVAMGKHISETTYLREEHEIRITDDEDDIVLDFYDKKQKVIHEVKKSDKMEETHIWQVKFYLSVLEKKGIDGATGEIDYPKLRRKEKVTLTEKDRIELERIKADIKEIVERQTAPPTVNKPFCKKCAYYDLCYV